MECVLANADLFEWVKQFGSPLNLLSSAPMVRNIAELNEVAISHDLDFKVYFARKANKGLTFVAAAVDAGAGIDVASEIELLQCLEQGIAANEIFCTAAVKNESLIQLCVHQGIPLTIDNHDELEMVHQAAAASQRRALVAIRLSGFEHVGSILHSRFGVSVEKAHEFCTQTDPQLLDIVGIHFHLNGYSAAERVSGILQSLEIVHGIRRLGHSVSFLDIGGGIPISYLADEAQWREFWLQHSRALLGHRSAITYRTHGLGLRVVDGKIVGQRNCYPFFQSLTRADWLDTILGSPDTSANGGSVADALRRSEIQLRCEPGRSILDGCGITVARVEFCKIDTRGEFLVGLSMNRTQCRTSSDDFLVDPILIPKPSRPAGEEMEGYLVGAYCTESELICQRKLRFPAGIQRGDLIVFPNTAGYFMHFLESRSHQFPLAKNVIVTDDGRQVRGLDAIEAFCDEGTSRGF